MLPAYFVSIARIAATNRSASTREPYSPRMAADPKRALSKITLTPVFSFDAIS